MIEFTFISGSDTLFIKSEKVTAVKAVKTVGLLGIDRLQIFIEGTSEPMNIDRGNIKTMKINGKAVDTKKASMKALAKKILEAK